MSTQTAVNTVLTPKSRTQGGWTNRPTTSRKRRRDGVENTDYAAFAARVIRAHARRITDGDVDALADLLRLADDVDAATQTVVTGLRSSGYSWGEIAARLGTTRQAAQQRLRYPVMTPDAAAWVRAVAWQDHHRATVAEIPSFYSRCACQFGQCGHCAAERQRLHRRRPD